MAAPEVVRPDGVVADEPLPDGRRLAGDDFVAGIEGQDGRRQRGLRGVDDGVARDGDVAGVDVDARARSGQPTCGSN